jgi:hypothetical protein
MRRATPKDRFFRVARTTRRTSEGPVQLPILYYDVSNVIALFEADLDGARALLEGTGLEPGVVTGHRATVALSFYEYRHTTVGVYNEVGTAIFTVREGEPRPPLPLADMLVPPNRRRIGAYVVDLPVTTEAANAAGREIWGYPKFVTPIPFTLSGRRFRSAVMDPASPDDALCELAGRMGPGVPAPPMSLMTYTRLDGALIRTHVDVRGMVMARAPGDLTLRVGASEHRMARNLRTLGLDGARPRLVLSTHRFQSKLHEGTPIA